MIALVVVAALGVAAPDDGCRGVLDRTDACASPAAVADVARADAKVVVVADPHHDAVEVAAPSLAVAGTVSLVAGAAVLGVAYAYASSLVYAVRAGPIEDAHRDRLVWGQRLTTGGAVALFAGSTLFYGAAAAFAAFDPRTGALLLPLFPPERE